MLLKQDDAGNIINFPRLYLLLWDITMETYASTTGSKLNSFQKVNFLKTLYGPSACYEHIKKIHWLSKMFLARLHQGNPFFPEPERLIFLDRILCLHDRSCFL